jgi:hypothetical protein
LLILSSILYRQAKAYGQCRTWKKVKTEEVKTEEVKTTEAKTTEETPA